MDPFSVVAPSRARVLALPAGKIKRSMFAQFVDRLRASSVVKLADVKDTAEATRTLFLPKSFPQGQISYDVVTAYSSDHEYLEAFELHRRTMMVIMVADHSGNNNATNAAAAVEEVKQQYPRALVHPLFIFGAPASSDLFAEGGEGDSVPQKGTGLLEYPDLTFAIPSEPDMAKKATAAAMADVTALFLAELSGLAKSIQALPNIDSPMSSSDNFQPGSLASRMSMPVSLSGGGAAPGGAGAASGIGPRISMTGFGSGSVTDRSRNRGKGRIMITVAHLHLLAGQVVDALREFVDGANAAKAYNDHLWFGKAIEGATISMMIMTYLGLDFKIPTLILSTAQVPAVDRSSKAPASSSSSTTGASSPSLVSGDGSPQAASSTPPTPSTLFSLIPDILSNLLSSYSRAANFAGEQVPPIVYSETIIRFSKLLVAGYNCGGLSEECLAYFVTGTKLPSSLRPQGFKGLKRTEIATTVMRAYPLSLELLPLLDTARILGGISSVLDMLGFHRRKALITRELVQALIPGLIQARVVGAAEIGVHPAASAVASANVDVRSVSGNPFDLDNSDLNVVWVEGLLANLCRSYGISIRTANGSDADTDADGKRQQQDLRDDLSTSTRLQRFGWHSLKIGVLRSCIQFCEALPEYEGCLRFTTALLQIAGRDLGKIEQGKLAESFTRTVGQARRSGLDDGKGGVANYWDEYLLRDIELIESVSWPAPVPHSVKEIDDTIEAGRGEETNPFIYNPFLKTPNTAPESSKYIVEGESIEFRVTLQNPYEFEIQVDKIELATEGVSFESASISTVIGPYRRQTVYVAGTPKESGSVRVVGCRVKVYGCVECLFPVLPVINQPELEVKTKAIGLAAASQTKERPASTSTLSTNPRNSNTTRAAMLAFTKPVAKELELAVLSIQPLVSLKKSSLPQSAVMVLEGERQIFRITLENISPTPADLVLFSFSDSTTGPIQAAISQKQAQPAEVYELELILLKKQAFTWLKPSEKASIPANGEVTYEVEVLGKPGLTAGTVQIDYGHLGQPISELQGSAYTRQLLYPLTVTVNASIELVRVDLLPFGADLTSAQVAATAAGGVGGVSGTTHGQVMDQQFKELFESISANGTGNKFCLLLVDLRNSWPHPLQAKLAVAASGESEEGGPDSVEKEGPPELNFVASDVIPAGHSTRIVLPVRRVFISNPHSPIPSHSGVQRQFVVSNQKFNPEQERQSREQFWYREELLKQLSGTWQEVGTSRHGQIDLRGFRLSPRMVDTIRIEDIGVHIDVRPVKSESPAIIAAGGRSGSGSGSSSSSSSRHMVQTNTFLKLTVSIVNRLSRSVSLLLRLLPSLKHQTASQDLSRKLVFDGNLQNAVGTVKPGQVLSVDLGCLVLCAGEYEIGGGVEEIILGDEAGDEEIFEYDFGLVEASRTDRKVWIARETCTIIAKDEG